MYQQDVAEEFSLTLCSAKSTDKLVFSFSSEEDFSAWYDALQMKVNDVISISSIDFSPHTLFQIFAILAINHGISVIERDLISFQPPIPPLPTSSSYSVQDTSKIITNPIQHKQRKGTTRMRVRRNTTWIEDREITQEKDSDSFDIDKMVDAKLSQLTSQTNIERSHSIENESPRGNPTSPRQFRRSITNPVPISPRGTGSGGWIRANDHSANQRKERARQNLLSKNQTQPDLKLGQRNVLNQSHG